MLEAAEVLSKQFAHGRNDVFTDFLAATSEHGKAAYAWLTVLRSVFLLQNTNSFERGLCLTEMSFGEHLTNYDLV